MTIRKDHATLSDAEKQDFVAAILALKQMPSMLQPGAGTRSRYDDYVELHVKSMMAMPDGWAHRGPAFFPWHRVLLLQFERDLQQAIGNPDLGVPYWDWIKDPAFPAFLGGDGKPDKNYEVTDGPFTRDAWMFNVVDGPGAPTYLQRRFGFGDLDNAGSPVQMKLPEVAAQDNALRVRWYDASPWDATSPTASSFREGAEVDLHNRVHRWVGGFWVSGGALTVGTMMQMTSPNDPVFWLHHCNLDRMWSAWQALHPNSAAYLPIGGAAQGHNRGDTLEFGHPMPWMDMYAPAMVIDTRAIGVEYDTLQQLSAPPPAPPMRAMEHHHGRRALRHDPRRMFPLRGEV